MSEGNIKRASLAEIRSMKDRSEIGLSTGTEGSDDLGQDFWADADVLAYFKAPGRGHLTRINAVLKAYVEADRGERTSPDFRGGGPRSGGGVNFDVRLWFFY